MLEACRDMENRVACRAQALSHCSRTTVLCSGHSLACHPPCAWDKQGTCTSAPMGFSLGCGLQPVEIKVLQFLLAHIFTKFHPSSTSLYQSSLKKVNTPASGRRQSRSWREEKLCLHPLMPAHHSLADETSRPLQRD